MNLMWVDRSSCGEKGAERGRGLGPWTVHESFREDVVDFIVVDAGEED